ncbi:TssA family type VI secretion system protein [Alcaligenes ammonioxydans]|jgi:type VI secretion system protein VasJ|uniref:TssA family type VI secretion system protein n=1 Tax=Alcaligenes TaxID=507 RepID=UPI000269EB2B|nr:TssA family type VI secretion system protein [Alcaligenes ammonioxydans]EJC65579.1 hypothetical protein QWA_01935 [Alcaligenes faecalis subsp. faecalis NCIB 8687]MCH1878426.1 TssA family type VI secretion system protein [Alcaligenes ammonioxydans]HRK85395.1 TssA family type VI secretion system protein [Alcaligenes faecalis]
MLDKQLGVRAINETLTHGHMPRDGETFASLQAEVGKRVDMHAATPVDWSLVASLATQVLDKEGKDLSAGVWLCAAWLHEYGTRGLAAGLQVIRDLHTVYWDVMSPPAARIRGRRNQVQWLLDECDAVLSEPDWDTEGLDSQQRDEVLALCDELDAFWQAKDDEPPAWWRLGKRLGELLPTAQSEAPDAQTSSETPVPDFPRSEPAQDEPAVATQTAAPVRVAKEVAQPVHSEVAPDSVSDKALAIAAATLSDVVAAERYVEQSVATIQESLLTLDDALLATAWLLRLNRQSAWLFLDTLPHAQEGVTRVAPPPVADLAVLERLSEAQDPAAILRFAESRLGRMRFWLDLNRLSYQAAQALPQGQPGAQTILIETQAILQRLPGLERLAFSDGRPFADEQTRAWLTASGTRVTEPAPAAGHAEPPTETARDGEGLDVFGLTSLVMAAGAEAEAARRLLDGALARLKTGGEQLMRAR